MHTPVEHNCVFYCSRFPVYRLPRQVALACRIALLSLFSCLAVHPAEVNAIITDPTGLAVPRALVEIACGHAVISAWTDAHGKVRLDDGPYSPCVIRVKRSGFAPFERELVTGETALRIQLSLWTQRSSITVTARPDYPPDPATNLATISLDESELKKIANDSNVWVNYAKTLAGVADRPTQVYVDGLPANELPPPEMIARIIINPDEFSAEYSDGDYTHVEIITKAPLRQFHFNVSTDSLGVGGDNALASGPGTVSHSGNGALSGAVPYLPLTFAVHASFSETVTPVAVTAVLPGDGFPAFDSARSGTFGNRFLSFSPDVFYYAREGLRLHFSYSESRSAGTNFGVGGLTLMDAGMDSSSTTREGRLTFNAAGKRLAYRGGFTVSELNSDNHARNGSPGLNVLGDFSTGGPAILSGDSTHISWNWKTVVEPGSGQSWSAGFTASGTEDSRDDTPNPGGVFTFTDLAAYGQALDGSATATWSILRGNGVFHVHQVAAAPFFQKQLLNLQHLTVNAGVRADAQFPVGVFVSPRLSVAAEWHRFVIRAGAGMFVHNVPNNVFVQAAQDDGTHLTPILVSGVGLNAASLPITAAETAPLIRTSFSPSLAVPRQLMEKISVSHPLGRLTPAIEYTQTRDWKLLGSQRFADASGWMDVIASNRARIAQRLRTQMGYSWKAARLTLYHEWVHSYDNTDGPFSFPEQQNNLAAEWARSTGAAAQNITMASSFNLRNLFLTLTDSWHGSAPYNIVTGLDPESDGLFNDRGGRSRNSGNGPGFNSLSAYLTRRYPLPKAMARIVHGVTLGLRGDNLLNNRDVLSLGSVAGSPTFAQPLAVAPGRSVRIWFSFD